MTTIAVAFMLFSMTSVVILTTYCMTRILRKE